MPKFYLSSNWLRSNGNNVAYFLQQLAKVKKNERFPLEERFSCVASIVSSEVLRTYKVTTFLLVKVFLTVQAARYKLRKIKFAGCLVLALGS